MRVDGNIGSFGHSFSVINSFDFSFSLFLVNKDITLTKIMNEINTAMIMLSFVLVYLLLFQGLFLYRAKKISILVYY